MTPKQRIVYQYLKELEKENKPMSASSVAIKFDMSLRRTIGILEGLEKENKITKDGFVYKINETKRI